MFPFATLMTALEQPFQSPEILYECEMTAAAQWMIISAPQMWDRFRAGTANMDPCERQALGESRTFTGRNVLSMNRCEWWTAKL
jgi:hypothetical protein